MKTKIWILIIIGLVIVVGGIGYHHATRNARRHEAGAPVTEIYAMYCARCHGLNGEGVEAYPALKGMKLELDVFSAKVKSGANLMPSFEKTLEDRELLPLWQHIKTFSP